MRNVLKYPGSKWRIADELVKLLPEHHTYVEPFFGSGAVFFKKEPSDIEMVNDMDDDVINLFRCIQEDSKNLARLVMTTPYSRKCYEEAFYYDSENSADPYHKACQFLVKCWQGHGFRTNKYRVGWKNDVVGREKMYALWNWYRLPEWIIEIAERLRCVQIENKPALDVINRFNYDNVFMYLDPPYLLETRTAEQYKHEMTNEDHRELLDAICNSKAKIMISGYSSALYDEKLKDWYRIEFDSHAEQGLKRKEVVWMNYKPDKEDEQNNQMSLDLFV